jgi:hypothetical protein
MESLPRGIGSNTIGVRVASALLRLNSVVIQSLSDYHRSSSGRENSTTQWRKLLIERLPEKHIKGPRHEIFYLIHQVRGLKGFCVCLRIRRDIRFRKRLCWWSAVSITPVTTKVIQYFLYQCCTYNKYILQ